MGGGRGGRRRSTRRWEGGAGREERRREEGGGRLVRGVRAAGRGAQRTASAKCLERRLGSVSEVSRKCPGSGAPHQRSRRSQRGSHTRGGSPGRGGGAAGGGGGDSVAAAAVTAAAVECVAVAEELLVRGLGRRRGRGRAVRGRGKGGAAGQGWQAVERGMVAAAVSGGKGKGRALRQPREMDGALFVGRCGAGDDRPRPWASRPPRRVAHRATRF